MNVSEIDEFIGAFLILIGSVISVISAMGIIRFPDVYTRAHAATKSTTLGVQLSLVGAFIYIWMTEHFISVRLILGILFVFITAPVSGHLIIRAAYRSKVKMTEDTIEDELKAVLDNKMDVH
ncbi:monovalent cation/H+ antiporter subunit G [Bacillus freudenreichii]|nr:monovalent cation/H+ antiporter subunit G [Bacillus freudenreichii]